MARPPKLTPETQATVLQAVRAHLPLHVAASMAGVHRETLRAWIRRGDPERTKRPREPYRTFFVEYQRAAAASAATLTVSIAQAARSDWRAARFLLERIHGPGQVRQVVDLQVGQSNREEAEDLEVLDPTEASQLDLALHRHRRLVSQLDAAEEAESYQAVAALTRQIQSVEAEILTLRDAGTPLDDMEEEEVLARLRQAAEDMPESHLRAIAEVWLQRHRLTTVRDETQIRDVVEAD